MELTPEQSQKILDTLIGNLGEWNYSPDEKKKICKIIGKFEKELGLPIEYSDPNFMN